MEIYTEKLVKKQLDNKELFLKALIICGAGLIVYIAVSLLGFEFKQWALCFLVAASAAYFAWFLFKRTSVEYDYSYCNGEFDIDVIYGQHKRKDFVTFDVADCESIAPYSISSDPAKTNGSIMKKYYALSRPGAKNAYAAVFSKNGIKSLAVFEADEDVVNDLKTRARNVFRA